MYNKIKQPLEVLNTKIRFLGRTKVEDHLAALDKIAELGNPYDAKFIIHLIFSNNEQIATKTATVVRKLLTKNQVKTPWLNLYSSFSYFYTSNGAITKNDLKRISKFPAEDSVHLFGIASLNHNGYVREAALEYLSNLDRPEIIPYILLRLNDWVPQVRSAAKITLDKIIPQVSVTDLVKYHDLIEWLEKTERVKLKDVQQKIFDQLHLSKNRTALFEAMRAASYKERLFCWKALAEEIRNDPTLIDKAIVDPSAEIRQWAARNLPRDISLKSRLMKLLIDKVVRVRYAALKAVPSQDFLDYKEFFEKSIFDDSKPMREYARFVLRSYGNDSHADRYRKRLSELQSKTNAGVLAGLAETGTQADIEVIRSFIDHKNPKIRAYALSALNRLRATSIDDLYILALQDDNVKVRNACAAILQSGHGHLRSELEDLLENGNIKSQRAALKVLTHYGVLESLQDILFAITQENKVLQNSAWQYLVSWHHQYSVKLWFNYAEDTYKHTVRLLDKLQQENIEPPHYADAAWKDLPNIMSVIKRK